MSINLNVSGRIFKVQKEILCQSQLFNNMFADCDTIDNEIMVYRSSKLFEHVYAYLLDDKYPYPKKYYAELDYYLINYNISFLFDPITRLKYDLQMIANDNQEEIKSSIANMRNEIKDNNKESLEMNSKCPVSYCDKKCMLPVCEEHRGTCCYYGYLRQDGPIACWDRERCEINVCDDEIYCRLHKYDR